MDNGLHTLARALVVGALVLVAIYVAVWLSVYLMAP